MRNTNRQKTVYHTAHAAQTARTAHAETQMREQARQLRSEADGLERGVNAADTLSYSRMPEPIAGLTRARDVALLRARAEQLDCEADEEQLEYAIAERQHGVIGKQAEVVLLSQRATRQAWRAYEDAEDTLRAATESERQ